MLLERAYALLGRPADELPRAVISEGALRARNPQSALLTGKLCSAKLMTYMEGAGSK